MTELDLRLKEELDVLFPVPRAAGSWDDVLGRARPRILRRRFVLALAAAVIVLGSAAAVTAALGGFDAWLSGKPGKPASSEEQARFEAANGRSWSAFPAATELRELVGTTVAGKRYVLFGFRSGSTLCLKLKAVSLGHSTPPACTPLSTVAHATAPMVVAVGDWTFADRHNHPSAEVSFGIAADGISRVDVDAVDGPHRAVLGGNAYLFVEDEPNTGNRVLSLSAGGVTVPLGLAGSARPARGPAQAAVHIAHPEIGWAVRGEERGFSAARLDLTPGNRAIAGDARFVKPDPLSDVVVGLDGAYCLVVVEGKDVGRSCSSRASFFSRAPVNMITSCGLCGQSATVAGAAADGIARVVVFGADGQDVGAPLRDNLFAVRLAVDAFPARVVAYDAQDRVAGVETLSFGLRESLPADALRDLRVVDRLTGPNGAIATLRVGPVVHGLRCWQLDTSIGASRRGCEETAATGPWTAVDLVEPAGGDLFVLGHVRAPVERVRLRFADGDTIDAPPEAGLFLFAIPRAHLSTDRQLAFALGLRGDGAVQQRQGVLFRLSR
jgi:hypothetical protein